ncbi:hypothetical protein apy_03050 [Aeropyrum pernix]|uniref:3-octaprenyl-4-hydroxybenzoate carboxy-lyase n=1 Tax=Aeropyrum pernix TaxID=56636 RepID=A0A401H864_AERPX|nr:UbiD family decarboxylase [Aeropyrum pernix]GBF08580.1 hypothetical protein apy_03050 [Aeropyrum pernix]
MKPIADLRSYLEFLESKGMLRRVSVEASPILEIPEILRRVMYRGSGYAVLFEKVKGHEGFRIAGNIFCSLDVVREALGVERLEVIGERLFEPLKGPPPLGIGGKLRSLGEVLSLGKYMPKAVGRAGFTANVLEGREASFNLIPAFKVWPKDGGRYLTYALVHVRDPVRGVMNMGVYRVMIAGDKEGVVHWQIHKRGMQAQQDSVEKGERRLPAALVIGSDPGTLLTGAMPVPYPIDKHLFAGVVRGEGLPVYRLPNGIHVPANAEIVLEGYIDLEDLREEGPYGDHFGYYDKPSRLFPTFRLERVWHRDEPIYYGSVTGKPPLEDVVIGKFAERIFLPAIQTLLPEVVDIDLPPHGVFQGMAFVSIRKRYPGHGKKALLALMGLGQLSLTKIIVVVDHDINVHDVNQVIWAVSSHVDPQRDVLIVPHSHTDELDPATPTPMYGSKLGIDATRKLPEEYGGKQWPEEVAPDPETVRLVEGRWREYGLD